MSLDFIKQYAPNLSKEAEDHAYKTSPDYIEHVAKTTKNTDMIYKLLNHHDPFVNEAAASNPNIDSDTLGLALAHKRNRVRIAAASNPSISSVNLHMALADFSGSSGEYVRKAAALNPNAKDSHFKEIFNDIFTVRKNGASNPAITKEYLARALRDPSNVVKMAAFSNPRYQEFYPNGHS
jgi:hypothetical protein